MIVLIVVAFFLACFRRMVVLILALVPGAQLTKPLPLHSGQGGDQAERLYRAKPITEEFLKVLRNQIVQVPLEDLFIILFYESTDISVIDEMVVCSLC